MSDNEKYLTELLEDVKFVLESHRTENSQVRKQLINLLSRKNASGEQPFKVRQP